MRGAHLAERPHHRHGEEPERVWTTTIDGPEDAHHVGQPLRGCGYGRAVRFPDASGAGCARAARALPGPPP
ncbi:hypothetical protein, partial [Streptomyces europaeiscabiei]|uniref:hypothetical protein n=1 Tax=Streptomyces europaeiscabiei TaxID=146819 RepID=UPI001F2B4685